jgi:hypothetical protein
MGHPLARSVGPPKFQTSVCPVCQHAVSVQRVAASTTPFALDSALLSSARWTVHQSLLMEPLLSCARKVTLWLGGVDSCYSISSAYNGLDTALCLPLMIHCFHTHVVSSAIGPLVAAGVVSADSLAL